MSSSSTATLPLPVATPHLRAVRSVPPVSVPPVSAVPSVVPSGVPSGPSVSPQSGAVAPPAPASLLAALPEGAAVVAALPQGVLPQGLLAQYGAQTGAPAGHPMVGYLVLVPAESPAAGPLGLAGHAAPGTLPGGAGAGLAGSGVAGSGLAGTGAAQTAVRPVRPAGRGIAVDAERRNAYVDGRLLDLTYLEFELLAHLTEHPQRVHTRDHLVSAVWGYGHVGDGRTVDVHVARLRRKLGPAYRDSIVTVRRVGYKYTPVN
ncbi:winged helix-turn-helix domain-containing protein [Kitasatospora sp. NPDC059827]|uniref:winged helix-turn-helix domain-containing protein n=1 Tax=Kitasatospora sp. NPDC059827 TaxID=3346964 RepID=UPI00365DA985